MTSLRGTIMAASVPCYRQLVKWAGAAAAAAVAAVAARTVAAKNSAGRIPFLQLEILSLCEETT